MPALLLRQDRRKFVYLRGRSCLTKFEYPSWADKFPCGNAPLLQRAKPVSLPSFLKLPFLKEWGISLPHGKVQYPLTAEFLQSWVRSQIAISLWPSLWQSSSKSRTSLIVAYENWGMKINHNVHYFLSSSYQNWEWARNSHFTEEEAEAEWINETGREGRLLAPHSPPYLLTHCTTGRYLSCCFWLWFVRSVSKWPILSCSCAEPVVATLGWSNVP